jgi:alcohol dehydrogenase
MADFIFKIQPNIVLGSYTSARLGQFSKEWGTKFMVIVDPLLKQLGAVDKLLQSLTDRNIDFFTFDELPEAADTEVIKEALTLAKEAHIHGIIAIGSSKTINVAKAVCALFHETHDLYDFIDGAAPSTAPLPLICVPSTIREPFIFSDRAPIIDARSSEIKLLKTTNGLCKLALFDPNLTLTLTENQTAAMAIETLCIATEAYLSPKASFFSDMVIEKAIELMGYGLDGSRSLTVTTPQEVLLSQSGCMASLGATSSSIGACALIAMCVNARYKISRALTTEILFPYVIEDAVKYKSDRLARISHILNACPVDANEKDAVSALTEYVRQHIAKVNLPSRLKDLGLTIEQLSLAAEDAGSLDLINTLPRSMSADDLFDLIKVAY